MKRITISYSNIGGKKEYTVEKLSNSIEFKPGDALAEKQVQTLCADPNWNVAIVPYVRK